MPCRGLTAKNRKCTIFAYLINEKEFSRFDNTNERLDLLALDKEGNVVVIENKSDDSGTEVTWQALKYVSYCANFTSNEIINIYQEYLEKNEEKKDAKEAISDFLESEALEEKLNQNQRIILVAGEFRREVTSTVLWLLGKTIDIRCVKVSLHKHNDDILVDFDQILPLKEMENHIIGLQKKEAEKNELNRARREAKNYWEALLGYLRENQFGLKCQCSTHRIMARYRGRHCGRFLSISYYER